MEYRWQTGKSRPKCPYCRQAQSDAWEARVRAPNSPPQASACQRQVLAAVLADMPDPVVEVNWAEIGTGRGPNFHRAPGNRTDKLQRVARKSCYTATQFNQADHWIL
jgi:hypothetical protein